MIKNGQKGPKGQSKKIFQVLKESQTTMSYEVAPKEGLRGEVIQHNIESTPLSRIVDWHTEFVTLRQKPISEAHIIQMCEELVACARMGSDCFTLEEFLFAKNISYRTWDRWCDKFPIAQEATEFVKMGFGAKRENLALKGDITPSVFAFVQPHYSRVWKEQMEVRESIKASASNSQQGTIVAQLIKFPVSDIVPDRAEGVKGTMSHLEEERDAQYRKVSVSLSDAHLPGVGDDVPPTSRD